MSEVDRKRVLKEAQTIASSYSFWMVSGNISHLYGRAYETSDIKYELEIKFPDEFPQVPPKFIYHEKIKELLGDIHLQTLENWAPTNKIIDAIDEVKIKIQKALNISIKEPEPLQEKPEIEPIPEQENGKTEYGSFSKELSQPDSEQDYITPDLNAYPPEEEIPYLTSDTSGDNLFYDDSPESDSQSQPPTQKPSSTPQSTYTNSTPESQSLNDSEYLTPAQPTDDFEEYESEYSPEEMFMDSDTNTLAVNTELGLIQQTYAYDQKGSSAADIVIYLTITLTKTFLINVDFSNYPKRPNIIFPGEVRKLIGEPYNSLQTLKNWKKKNPPHVVDVLHELEQKLFTIKTIEDQLNKIFQEYQYERIPNDLTKVRIHLLTYGFEEYQ
ncbi:MAG: hypothetical protein GF311_05755, partial [Candidatus Lokiarchaeota archaeon]|nr:hypothetical protein [Candidatus Lokiarchaeota archaeon]